jgi:hypothetical protein
MTSQEAAAKCREWAVRAKKDMKQYDADEHSYHYQDGLDFAYMAAANLIDQINQPQPWPPPEEMEEVLAYNPRMKFWGTTGKGGRPDWQHINEQWGPFSHYLPMPPAPEVKP